jgi:hypothetical protein
MYRHYICIGSQVSSMCPIKRETLWKERERESDKQRWPVLDQPITGVCHGCACLDAFRIIHWGSAK